MNICKELLYHHFISKNIHPHPLFVKWSNGMHDGIYFYLFGTSQRRVLFKLKDLTETYTIEMAYHNNLVSAYVTSIVYVEFDKKTLEFICRSGASVNFDNKIKEIVIGCVEGNP